MLLTEVYVSICMSDVYTLGVLSPWHLIHPLLLVSNSMPLTVSGLFIIQIEDFNKIQFLKRATTTIIEMGNHLLPSSSGYLSFSSEILVKW